MAAATAILFAPVAASAQNYSEPTGEAAPFTQYQPSMAVSQYLVTQGTFPSRFGRPDAAPSNNLGLVRTWATRQGLGEAAGQLLPISSNVALFSVFGTTYGGDGRSNFALPDLRDRTIVGASPTAGVVSGALQTVLTASQMPVHAHGIDGLPTTTGPSGGSQPFSNLQPSLAMTYLVATRDDPSGQYFAGQVAAFAGSYAPDGWVVADGSVLQSSLYPELAARLGTVYGGDGVGTFALPDLRGRTAVGADALRGLGQAFGSGQTTLTTANLPAHGHDAAGLTILDTGGGQPFDNYQPSLALNFFVAVEGQFPIADRNPANVDQAVLGEIVMSASGFAPSGFLAADGRLLNIAVNQALFSLFGTTYGGDGRTNFALPDLRGRSLVGAGGQFTVGQLLGQGQTTLSVANLPPHVHQVPDAPAAIPEPGTWALMIAGLGLVGGALRGARRRAAATA
jgi:microcystin-dependent protein